MSKIDQARTWEGRVVEGKFRLRQYLGGSDHSAVFVTEAAGNTAQKIAIKLIEVDAGDVDNQLSRLRAAAGLTHPHLIRVFDIGRTEIDSSTFLYATMEFADEDLSQILPQRALTPDEVRDMLPPVLEALAFLHGRGFVQGALKPSNVYAVGEQLKLSADQITAVGKPLRALAGQGASTTHGGETAFPASDIRSLGATLVATLTQKEVSATNASVPENISEPFRGIARDCLQADPKRRPSLEQIYSRLQAPAVSAPAATTPVAAKPPQAARAPETPSRGRLYGIAAVIVIAIILLGYFLFRSKETSTATSQPATPSSETTQPSEATAPPRNPSSASPAATTAGAADGRVVRRIDPDIPANAQHTISGIIKIRARVEVDTAGKVTTARLISSGPSRYFSERALNAARQWEFSPPVKNGQPTRSVWLIQFRLRHNSIQDSAAQLNP